MRRSEVSTVKTEVVLLLAVIGQRLTRNLSSGDPSPVSEYRKEKGIHAATLLKHIQDFLGTFIYKRNCSDLYTDHFRGHRRTPGSWHRQGSSGACGDLQEFAAIHIQSHGLPLFLLVNNADVSREMAYGSCAPSVPTYTA